MPLATDVEGRPVRLRLPGGQAHAATPAPALVRGWQLAPVMAAKAYDSQAFGDGITARGAIAVMPPRSNRKPPRADDPAVDTPRHRIEGGFNTLEQFRRMAARDDRNAGYGLACS